MITVYIDTNRINARGKLIAMGALERLHDNDLITIKKTDTLDTELQRGYRPGLDKSAKYEESMGMMVWDNSRWDHATWATDDNIARLDAILRVVFGPKDRNEYRGDEIRDAMHISTAIEYGGDYFVTDEKAICSASTEVELRYGLKIRTDEGCLAEIRNILGL